MMPGISRNCRRTSCTIAMAACPTAVMASAEKMNGIMAPTNRPASTRALEISMVSMWAVPIKAANSASDPADNGGGVAGTALLHNAEHRALAHGRIILGDDTHERAHGQPHQHGVKDVIGSEGEAAHGDVAGRQQPLYQERVALGNAYPGYYGVRLFYPARRCCPHPSSEQGAAVWRGALLASAAALPDIRIGDEIKRALTHVG
nr:hypothetical protein [Tanacetum cinerariifolium]